MKKLLFLSLFLTNQILAAELVEKVESPVFQHESTASQLTSRGKVCIAELVKFESGSNSATNPIIIEAENKIIANSRFEYTYLLLRHSAKSKLVFEARDGRFKITHTDIGYKQVATSGGLAWGASKNDNEGHIQLAKVWGTGWEELEKQLQNLSVKVADCVIREKKQDW